MQIIGIYQRAGDLDVNACKKKAATNIRRCCPGLAALPARSGRYTVSDLVCLCSATKEQMTVLQEPIRMSLDDCLEYVADDELVEVQALLLLQAACSTAAEARCVAGHPPAREDAQEPWHEDRQESVRLRDCRG